MVIRKLAHTQIQIRAPTYSFSCRHTNTHWWNSPESEKKERKRILKEEESIDSFPGADWGWSLTGPIILRVHEWVCVCMCEKERGTVSERGEGESWSGYSCPGAELKRRGEYCKNTTSSPLLLPSILPTCPLSNLDLWDVLKNYVEMKNKWDKTGQNRRRHRAGSQHS